MSKHYRKHQFQETIDVDDVTGETLLIILRNGDNLLRFTKKKHKEYIYSRYKGYKVQEI